jgi:hypothetical protein
MKAHSHSMPAAYPETSPSVHIVQVEVALSPPLLLLKQALPWEAITEAMTRHWRQHGKNVDGGPGLPWDVSLYVPLVVLRLIKAFDSRQMEAYVAENVVARVFIGRHGEAQAQIRDHSNIARAYAALGKAGVDEVNHLVIKEAQRYGLIDEGVLSADTTAQELPIGYPNEPGILRGLAQRCGRALTQLAKRGICGLDRGQEQVQTILRSVKEHHLFAAGKAHKREVLTRILKEVGTLIVQTRPLVERLATSADRVIQRARAATGDARSDQAPAGADRAVDIDGEGGGEQNRPCRHSTSASHCAQQGGQEDGVWLSLSDQPLGRGLSLWGAHCCQCRRKADATQSALGVSGDLWSEGDARVRGVRPRGRGDRPPPAARVGRDQGCRHSAQREAAVVGCRGSPGADSQRAGVEPKEALGR